MKTKITARALAGRCGIFVASGLTVPARACCSSKSDARASPPKPQKASRMNSRRVRVRRKCGQISLDIKKRVEVKHRERELLHRLLAQEGEREFAFLLRRGAAQRQPISALDNFLV